MKAPLPTDHSSSTSSNAFHPNPFFVPISFQKNLTNFKNILKFFFLTFTSPSSTQLDILLESDFSLILNSHRIFSVWQVHRFTSILQTSSTLLPYFPTPYLLYLLHPPYCHIFLLLIYFTYFIHSIVIFSYSLLTQDLRGTMMSMREQKIMAVELKITQAIIKIMNIFNM